MKEGVEEEEEEEQREEEKENIEKIDSELEKIKSSVINNFDSKIIEFADYITEEKLDEILVLKIVIQIIMIK